MLTYGFSPSTENVSDRLTGGFFNSLHHKTVTETENYDWWLSNPDFKGKS